MKSYGCVRLVTRFETIAPVYSSEQYIRITQKAFVKKKKKKKNSICGNIPGVLSQSLETMGDGCVVCILKACSQALLQLTLN